MDPDRTRTSQRRLFDIYIYIWFWSLLFLILLFACSYQIKCNMTCIKLAGYEYAKLDAEQLKNKKYLILQSMLT